MKILFLDTSTPQMIVGLLIDEKEEILTRDAKLDHGAYTIVYIQKILADHQVDVKQLDEIVVGIGPGSYTGIRVSVMLAKMLGSTLNKRVRSISSLAFLTSGYDEQVFAFNDAKNDAGFAGMYLKAYQVEKDSYKLVSELTEIQNRYLIKLDQTNFKINLKRVYKNSTIVIDVDLLEPNYLRVTEAERTYDQKSQNK